MPMTFVKPEELDSYVGKSLEPSEWLTIDPVSYTHLTLPTKVSV